HPQHETMDANNAQETPKDENAADVDRAVGCSGGLCGGCGRCLCGRPAAWCGVPDEVWEAELADLRETGIRIQEEAARLQASLPPLESLSPLDTASSGRLHAERDGRLGAQGTDRWPSQVGRWIAS